MSRIKIERQGAKTKIQVGDFVEICGNWYMAISFDNRYTFVSLEDGFMYTKPTDSLEDLQKYLENSYNTKFEKGVSLHRTEDVTMTLSIKEGK